ncbi:MAG: hypothetical protein IKN22_00740 [Bacteroidaceae bacterium]|jgi:hypothetical protein|nr:hypothetical protein [Bacteroidaceae bacterium]MDO4951522.1 hypothetical protein [Bacteroidales bacterium]MBR3373015.1 hypothetical protein [Bacteroidaceae bacterium]MBR3634100.1 hypothetical protein [Bacteroidaceae bacterium]MBR3733041.1 hypothetical protein [Bacteroidaceae bacterium]
MEKIKRARNKYIFGMILMIVAGYALITCGMLLFKLTPNFPVVPLAIASVLLIIYNVCAILVYIRMVRTTEKGLVPFYLANKVVRMIFALALIIGIALLTKSGKISFVISFFVLYLGTIIYESVFFVHIEKKLNELSKK